MLLLGLNPSSVLRREGLGGLRVPGALGVYGAHVSVLGSGVCRQWAVVVRPPVLVCVSYCFSDRYMGCYLLCRWGSGGRPWQSSVGATTRRSCLCIVCAIPWL